MPRMLAALWVVIFAGLSLIYLTVPVSPDQALFDYMAWSHLHGDLYYGGIAEQNFPGKMFLHETGVRLFGTHFWTFRAIDSVLLAGVSLAGASFLHRAGFEIASWVFLFLYPPLYVTAGYWMAGQRDIVAMGFLIVAAWLVVPPPTNRRTAASFAAGVLVALATLTRPTYLTALAGLALFEWFRFRHEPVSGIGTGLGRSTALLFGFTAVVAAVAGYGFALGILDDFYQQSILFNVEAYQVAAPRNRLFRPLFTLLATSWHWITALGALGALLWALQRGAARGLMLVAGLIVTVLVSYVVQNKGFGYHLGGLLPLMVLLTAVAIDRLVRLRQNLPTPLLRAAAFVGLTATITLAGFGTAKKLWSEQAAMLRLTGGEFVPSHAGGQPDWDEVRRSVDLIRAGSGPEDVVLQWGRIFTVPFLAERRSVLRFVSTPALEIMGPEFSGYEDWLAEIRSALAMRPPVFALIETSALAEQGEVGLSPRANASAALQIVLKAIVDYRVVQRTPHYLLLERP